MPWRFGKQVTCALLSSTRTKQYYSTRVNRIFLIPEINAKNSVLMGLQIRVSMTDKQTTN